MDDAVCCSCKQFGPMTTESSSSWPSPRGQLHHHRKSVSITAVAFSPFSRGKHAHAPFNILPHCHYWLRTIPSGMINATRCPIQFRSKTVHMTSSSLARVRLLDGRVEVRPWSSSVQGPTRPTHRQPHLGWLVLHSIDGARSHG